MSDIFIRCRFPLITVYILLADRRQRFHSHLYLLVFAIFLFVKVGANMSVPFVYSFYIYESTELINICV